MIQRLLLLKKSYIFLNCFIVIFQKTLPSFSPVIILKEKLFLPTLYRDPLTLCYLHFAQYIINKEILRNLFAQILKFEIKLENNNIFNIFV